jgi:hypothetical protein
MKRHVNNKPAVFDKIVRSLLRIERLRLDNQCCSEGEEEEAVRGISLNFLPNRAH